MCLMRKQGLDSPQEAHGSTVVIPQDWSIRIPTPEVRLGQGKDRTVTLTLATKGSKMEKETYLTHVHTEFHY